MNLRDRIYLAWLNGGWQAIIGGVYNVSAALLIAFTQTYALAVNVFILKIPFTAIVLYLSHKLRSRDTCFFYINLGFSRWHFQIVVLITDFILFFILMTIALMFNG